MKYYYSKSFIVSLLAVLIFIPFSPTLADTRDSTPPNTGDVFASSDGPTSGIPVTFYVNANDDVGVSQCRLLLDGNDVGAMPLGTSGSYGLSYTFPASTADVIHSAQARCYDVAGNNKTSVGIKYFHVYPASVDTTPPVIGAVSPTTSSAGSSVTYSASYVDSGSGGVKQCRLNEDGNIVWTSGVYGPNTTSGIVSVIESFSTGSHYLQFQCVDNANNWGYGTQTTVTVTAVGDATYPNVGDVFDNVDQPPAGSYVMYYVNANDNVGISQCRLLLDGNDVGAMPLGSSGSYGLNYYWPASNSDVIHSAQARCSDAAGNSKTSTGIKYFHVTPGVTSGSLIKLRCGSYAPVEDPCHAVYYRDTLGTRHAFPNGRVFLSWFNSFDQVTELDAASLQLSSLGRMVHYRPGSVMIKFPSVPRVYEIDRYGALRWILNEQTAAKLHGSAWSMNVVDESEANYSQYRFGSDLNYSTTYNPNDEQAAASSIEQSVMAL